MAPKPLTAQDVLNLAGVFSGMLGGQFRKLAGQSGVLPPSRPGAREGIEAVRGIFRAPSPAAKPAAASRYPMGGGSTPAVPRPEPPVAGVFQPPAAPALRTRAPEPPVTVPTVTQPSFPGVSRPTGSPELARRIEAQESVKLMADDAGNQYYIGPGGRVLSPREVDEAFDGITPKSIDTNPAVQGAMQGPVRAALPDLDPKGTVYRQPTLFSPGDNPAVRAFYEAGGQPKAFAYKKAGGFDAASQLVRESDEIPSLVYGPRPDGAPGQLPLNLRTDITSAWSPKGAELRNLMVNLQGRLPLIAGLGTAGVVATGATALNLMGRGGEETPLGPTTAKPPVSVEEQTAPNNVDATREVLQSEAARAAAADLAAGGAAAQTQRYSSGDSNLRQAAQAAAASARLDPSRTGGAQTAPTKGTVAAPADYKQIAQYYAARRQEALKPKTTDQTILELQASGALDKTGIAQWAAANPVLAYELNQKLRSRDISQQSQNIVGAEITSPLGSNVPNLVSGSTQGLIQAAEGQDTALKDVTNGTISTSIAPMPRDMQAFFNRVGFQNRAY